MVTSKQQFEQIREPQLIIVDGFLINKKKQNIYILNNYNYENKIIDN